MSGRGNWASRPLAEQARRRTFALAAVAVGVSAGALTLLVGPEPEHTRDRATSVQSPSIVATAVATTTPAPAPVPATRAEPPLGEREQAHAIAGARRFLTAYLRYEVGDDSAAVRHALRRGATKSFARQLLAHPPRVTAGAQARAGRIDGLELGDSATAEQVGVVATISRGQVISPLGLQLDRTEQGWRVSSIL